MKWIKSHPWIIACALGVLLCGKSCQSCSRQRTIEYNQAQYEHRIDSITTAKDNIESQLLRTSDSIKILNIELNNLKERYNIVEGTLEHTRTTNQSLIRSNNALSNQIEK